MLYLCPLSIGEQGGLKSPIFPQIVQISLRIWNYHPLWFMSYTKDCVCLTICFIVWEWSVCCQCVSPPPWPVWWPAVGGRAGLADSPISWLRDPCTTWPECRSERRGDITPLHHYNITTLQHYYILTVTEEKEEIHITHRAWDQRQILYNTT